MEITKIDTEIAKTFDVDIPEVQNMVKEYQKLTLVPDDSDSYKVCRKALTACVRTRTGIDKRRLELNSDDQKKIKKRNSAAKDLTALIGPAEDHLSGLVKGEDARKAEIEAEKEAAEKKLIQDRVDSLLKVGATMDYFDVASMSNDEFDVLFTKMMDEHNAELERLKKEADELKAIAKKEKADREAEAQLLADEGERLEKIRIEQEAKEAEIKEEQDKFNAEKKAAQDAKDREALEKRLAEEAIVKAKAEAEEEARIADDAERWAKDEARRKADLLPDIEKVHAWVKANLAMSVPELRDAGAKDILRIAVEHIDLILHGVETEIEGL